MQDDAYLNEIDTSELMDSVETIVNAVALDPIAIGRIIALLSNKTYTAIQKIPYYQLKRYIDGVKKAEDDLGKSCKLSEKLFSDPKKRNENAMRVYKMVTSSDTEKKIDYLVDATRSMLLGLIDAEMMFRVFRAIIDSMPEDLSYLSNLVEKGGPFKGNIRIHALERSGLMISAGIDADEDVEKQDYHISSLGYAVDRYVLSLNDEDRLKWYKNWHQDNRNFIGPRNTSDEEVDARVAKLFDENKQELIEAAKPKWEDFSGSQDNLDKIAKITQKKEAVTLLIYATRTEGYFYIMQDISHFNPYVEIGTFMLPDNDDARSSAAWTGAVKVLEETEMIECINYKDKIYRLTDDGWNGAQIYIEQNGISENDLEDPNVILQRLNED